MSAPSAPEPSAPSAPADPSTLRLPDPDKWISVNKVDRTPKQRPLVGPQFRAHAGIPTPPTTRKRKSAASNRSSQAKPSSQPKPTPTASRRRSPLDVTPPGAGAGSITSYLTPPSAAGASEKRKREPERLTGKDGDAVRKQDAGEPAGPDTPRVRLDPAIDRSVAAWMRSLPVNHPPRPSPAPASAGKAPARLPVLPLAGAVIQSSMLRGNRGPSGARRTAPRDWDVFEERDDAVEEPPQPKRARHNPEPDAKKPLGQFSSLDHPSSSPLSSGGADPLSPRNMNIGHLKRNTSAHEPPVCPRDPAWPRNANPPSHPRPQPLVAETVLATTPPRRRPLRTVTSTKPLPVAFPSSPLKRTPRRISPARHKVTPPKLRTHQLPARSRSPMHFAAPETMFEFNLPDPPPQPLFAPAPAPASAAAKSRTWKPVQMDAETLMTWSLGGGRSQRPAQSDIEAEIAAAAAAAEVAIDAELAQGAEGGLAADGADDDDDESIAPSIPSQSFPHLVESTPDRIPAFRSPRRGAAGQRAGEGTPKRSPLRRELGAGAKAGRAAPASDPSDSTEGASSPTPKRASARRKTPARGGSPPKWREHFLFATPSAGGETEPLSAAATSVSGKRRGSASGSVRAAKRRSAASPTHAQTTLEAFGYFSASASAAAARALTPDFGGNFSDAEDLAFDAAEAVPCVRNPSTATAAAAAADSSAPEFGRLLPVPDAPPHPHLRPAGVAALRQREADAMARHRAQTGSGGAGGRSSSGSGGIGSGGRPAARKRRTAAPSSDAESDSDSPLWERLGLPEAGDASERGAAGGSEPTDADSSSLGDDAPRVSDATKAWWDRLGDRSGVSSP